MAKSEKPTVNKADFVRGIPLDVRAKDVVQKAKDAGFSLSEAYVYGVRKTSAPKAASPRGTDRTKAARTAPAAAASKRAPARRAGTRGPSGPRAGSKKAFVLSFPSDTPARDILAAAQTKGVEMSAGYVYWVRSDATRNGRRGAPAARPAGRPAAAVRSALPPAPPAPASPRARGADAERLIVDMAIRVVGIERAIAILEAARGKLDRLIAD